MTFVELNAEEQEALRRWRLQRAEELPAEERAKLIELARDRHEIGSDDEIEIDEDHGFSVGEGGVWVRAWVWVPETYYDDDDDDDNPFHPESPEGRAWEAGDRSAIEP